MKALRLSILLLLAAFALPLCAQDSFTAYTASVTGDSVRVRSGAGIAYPPVSVMSEGDELTVVGEKEGWAIVQLPKDAPCWISADFVKPGDDGKTWVVTGDNVNLRVSADTKFFPVGQAAKDQVLTAATSEEGKNVSENGYVKVVPPANAHGAISSEFLKKIKNVAPEKAETIETAPADEPKKAEEAGEETGDRADDNGGKETVETPKDEPKRKPTAAELEDERKTFTELEKLLNDELKKPAKDVNLTDIRKMFEQFKEFSLDKDIGEKAGLYIEKIDLTVKLIETENARLDKEEADRKAKADAIAKKALEEPKEEQPKGPVEYTVTGTIGSTGKTAKTPASHRLFDKDGNVLYDLRWDKGDLGKLMGSKVGIVGKVKKYDGWPHKVIVIERVDVLDDGETK
ncbi:MAG: SH3 domain-containing protein [Planctomycetes bacterium]|nr:SH3 domain-containing protein [Planctomycetota bacterium]